MLNKEFTDYVDYLRKNHPGLEDSAISEALKGASWSPEEISEALERYKQPADPLTVVPAPIPAPLVTQNIQTVGSETPQLIASSTSSRSVGKTIAVCVGVVLVVAGISAGAYYAITSNFFGAPRLTDENLLNTVLNKLGEINTVDYTVNFGLTINPREAGAESYEAANPTNAATLAAYGRDEDRLRDIATLQQRTQQLAWDRQPFPATVEALLGKSKDPSQKAYGYRLIEDGKDYEFTLTLETLEAYTVVSSGLAVDAKNDNAKTVTLRSGDYVYAYGFTGEPEQPKLFGLFALSEIEAMIPSDLAANFKVGGTIDNSEEAPNGKLSVAGEVTLGDANFAFDAEGLKKGDKYFGIINKIPAFFSTMSQVKGKWVGFTEDDLRNYGYTGYIDAFVPSSENERQEELDKSSAQLEKIIAFAERHKLLSITSGPVKDKVGDRSLSKYTLSLNKDALLPFYEEVTEALKEYGDDALIVRDEEVIAYLKDEKFSSTFDYVKDSVTFTLWMDKAGFPAHAEVSVRYVPSDKAIALKEKQIDLIFSVALNRINEPIIIDEPANVVQFEDFLVDITGKEKEEIILQLQETNVTAIRNGLEEYFMWAGRYPETLSELTQKRIDVPKEPGIEWNTSTSDYSKYYEDVPFLKVLPNDKYTGKPFLYKLGASDYELTYHVKTVPYRKDRYPGLYYTTVNSYTVMPSLEPDVYVAKYTDGDNVATKNYLSQIQLQKADDDSDRLVNTLEAIFGTDPQKADSDSDGFSDSEELFSGSDPLGPGKLDYEYNGFSF